VNLRIFLAILAGFVLLGPPSGCQTKGSVAATESAKPEPVSAHSRVITLNPSLLAEGRIALSLAEKRDLTDELVVTGQVIAPPHGKAEIGALLNARIRKIFVEEGAVVKKGQVLATLVAPDAARITGDLAAARARRTRAETVLAQEQRLKEQHATSERAVTDAQSDAASARADEQAASVMLSSYNVSGAELTLRSPLDGVVAASNALLGVQVDPDTILFRIIDPTQLAVRADVPESMAARIRLGAIAEFQLPASRSRCKADVVASTRSVDSIKRTVAFRLRPTSACEGLLEGGFADVIIPLSTMHDIASHRADMATDGQQAQAKVVAEGPRGTNPAPDIQRDAGAQTARSNEILVVIPRSAIVEVDSVPSAFVALPEPGKFRLTPLTVRRHGDTQSLVEQGLTGGEQVVSKGALLLKGEWMKSRLE
jgi:RND family efflux transporter MFP subunit